MHSLSQMHPIDTHIMHCLSACSPNISVNCTCLGCHFACVLNEIVIDLDIFEILLLVNLGAPYFNRNNIMSFTNMSLGRTSE